MIIFKHHVVPVGATVHNLGAIVVAVVKLTRIVFSLPNN